MPFGDIRIRWEQKAGPNREKLVQDEFKSVFFFLNRLSWRIFIVGGAFHYRLATTHQAFVIKTAGVMGK